MVKIFSIDGNVGSGKSTLIRKLKEEMNEGIIFVLEPVDEWANIKDKQNENILTKFYRDQEKYSFSFQMMAYISRLVKLKNTIKAHPKAIIITERSIFTDKNVFAKMLYDDKKIEEVNYSIYLNWFNAFIEDIPLDGIIYIQADPKVSYERVLKRNRLGENIPLAYLERCHKYHEEWLRDERNILVLNANHDFENLGIHNWITKILTFVKNTSIFKTNNLYNKYINSHFC